MPRSGRRVCEQAGATCHRPARRGCAFGCIIALARVFGTNRVADLVRALEGDEEEAYASQLTPETAAIAADEREHAEIWDELTTPSRRLTDAGRRGAA